jgi:tetratricopeptide (TPR) repeat protein
LADGDDAMISAMLHNVATLRTNHVRVADAFGRAMPTEASRAAMEAESTQNYDLGIGSLALSSFVPLVRAQLLTAQGRFDAAVPIYSATLDHDRPENLQRRAACFYADRAWCYLRLGNDAAADADARSAVTAIDETCDPDDLAVTHARIAAVKQAQGNGSESAKHADASIAYVEKHEAAQCQLLDALQAANLALPKI